jgi:hypothetical protein
LENIAWLEWIGRNIGLQVAHCEVDTNPIFIDKPQMVQTQGRIRHRQAFSLLFTRFMAVARVTDTQQFEQGLIRGIGDSKAFGFGFIHFWMRGQQNA